MTYPAQARYWLLAIGLCTGTVYCILLFTNVRQGAEKRGYAPVLDTVLPVLQILYMQAKRERIQVSTKLRHLADFFCCLLSVGVVIDPMAYS